MPPAPSGAWISYGPSFIPEVSAMRANYSRAQTFQPHVLNLDRSSPKGSDREVAVEELFRIGGNLRLLGDDCVTGIENLRARPKSTSLTMRSD